MIPFSRLVSRRLPCFADLSLARRFINDSVRDGPLLPLPVLENVGGTGNSTGPAAQSGEASIGPPPDTFLVRFGKLTAAALLCSEARDRLKLIVLQSF